MSPLLRTFCIWSKGLIYFLLKGCAFGKDIVKMKLSYEKGFDKENLSVIA